MAIASRRFWPLPLLLLLLSVGPVRAEPSEPVDLRVELLGKGMVLHPPDAAPGATLAWGDLDLQLRVSPDRLLGLVFGIDGGASRFHRGPDHVGIQVTNHHGFGFRFGAGPRAALGDGHLLRFFAGPRFWTSSATPAYSVAEATDWQGFTWPGVWGMGVEGAARGEHPLEPGRRAVFVWSFRLSVTKTSYWADYPNPAVREAAGGDWLDYRVFRGEGVAHLDSMASDRALLAFSWGIELRPPGPFVVGLGLWLRKAEAPDAPPELRSSPPGPPSLAPYLTLALETPTLPAAPVPVTSPRPGAGSRQRMAAIGFHVGGWEGNGISGRFGDRVGLHLSFGFAPILIQGSDPPIAPAVEGAFALAATFGRTGRFSAGMVLGPRLNSVLGPGGGIAFEGRVDLDPAVVLRFVGGVGIYPGAASFGREALGLGSRTRVGDESSLQGGIGAGLLFYPPG